MANGSSWARDTHLQFSKGVVLLHERQMFAGLWLVVCWFVVCGLWFVVCGLWFVV